MEDLDAQALLFAMAQVTLETAREHLVSDAGRDVLAMLAATDRYSPSFSMVDAWKEARAADELPEREQYASELGLDMARFDRELAEDSGEE